MIDKVLIPHDDKLVPGTWSLMGGLQPVHRCPQCKVASEMLNHSVEPDGTVHASIACFTPCTYHVWGKLEGWTYGLKEAGKPVNAIPQ